MEKMSLLKQLFGKIMELHLRNFFFPRITELLSIRSRSPWLWPTFIFDRLPIGREHKKALKVLHGFSRKVVVLFQLSSYYYFISYKGD